MDPVRVIDAHVHFWDPEVLRYPWLDALPVLRRRFSFTDYPHQVDALLFVEANCEPRATLDEVQFVEEMAEGAPSIAGTIAYVDLTDSAGREKTLDELESFRRVVGVRHNIQGEPAGFALAPEFVRGVQHVGRRGYTFDLCVTAGQLGEVEQLVRRCPDTSFVLDHCGKPAIRSNAFASWAMDIGRLSEHENVACKLSGLLTEAHVDQRNDAAILPYAEHALRCFGASRMLYGSDWPVLTLAGALAQWRALVDRFTASWSGDERSAFYAGNATRIYNLRFDVTS